MPGSRVVVRILVSIAVVLSCHGAWGQALVEAVQFPAWLERGGATNPLIPGTVLQARDGIVTGGGGRARVRLAEGSRVRLGEHARVELRRDELAVTQGAFRFTTGNARATQDVALQVGAMAVLSRGADLWGEAGEPAVIVMVSGFATASAGGLSLVLERPLDRCEAARGGSPSLSRIRGEVLAELARGVEMAAEGATSEPNGRWRVAVGKFESPDHARMLAGNVRAAGFPAEIAGGGRVPFVVLVPGLAGESAARAAMARLRSVEGAGILTISESTGPSR